MLTFFIPFGFLWSYDASGLPGVSLGEIFEAIKAVVAVLFNPRAIFATQNMSREDGGGELH
jgi:hypothetical protein